MAPTKLPVDVDSLRGNPRIAARMPLCARMRETMAFAMPLGRIAPSRPSWCGGGAFDAREDTLQMQDALARLYRTLTVAHLLSLQHVFFSERTRRRLRGGQKRATGAAGKPRAHNVRKSPICRRCRASSSA